MSAHPVRVGLKLSPQGTTVEELRAVWDVADEGGFDHCWTFDHLAGIGDAGPGEDVLEAWTLLAAMAERTSRVRIGCMVTGNTYRHPALLAKMAVTVDRLSGGRLEVGIGAAWAEIEHTMLGLPFGSRAERAARLAEAVEVLRRLWTEERVDFAGEHYVLRQAVANPKPLQRPHPPIWIGGSGRRLTLRTVARLADVWNAPWGEPEEVAELSAVLDGHCAAVARDPSEIRRSIQFRYEGGPDLVELASRYVAAGATELVLMLPPGRARACAEAAAAQLDRLRGLG